MTELTNLVLSIGIVGGTGSGKTTVANKILGAIGENQAVILQQDSYYKDQSGVSTFEREKLNYDHPDALDNDLLISHLMSLKTRKPISVPEYDFASHIRTSTFRTIEPRDVIILEGILLFAIKEIRELLDIKLFVDTDSDIRFICRLTRDMAERGRSMESVINQYQKTVRPMHMEFVEPSKRFADLIIPENGHTVGIEIIIKNIKEHLRSNRAL